MSGQIRVGMDRGVHDFGIVGKFAIQHAQKIFRRIELVLDHGATQSRQASATSKIFIGGLWDGLFQEWNCFSAAAFLSQV